jgi:signal transduction histidine kinase
VSILIPRDLPDELPTILERLRRGERIEHYETVRVRGDGRHIDVSLTVSPIRDASGRVSGASIIARDVTERKEAERELESHAAELARSNRELQEFAYVASHDLQEPLRKVRTFGGLLEAKCGSELDELGRDYLSRMQNAAERGYQLINDLLALSRVTTSGRPFVAVPLVSVAQAVLSDLEVRVGEAGAQIELGELPTIEADPAQMYQLLQNLVANALKFRREADRPVIRIDGRLGQPTQSGSDWDSQLARRSRAGAWPAVRARHARAGFRWGQSMRGIPQTCRALA